MKNLVILAAALEIPTGVVLILAPSYFTWLLFGAEMSGPGEALAPLGGFALLALAVACWPQRGASGPPASAVRALLAFSLLCAAYLAYRGLTAENTGLLLWPAAVGHAVLAILLARPWLGARQQSTTS